MRDDSHPEADGLAPDAVPRGAVLRALIAAADAAGRRDPLIPLAAWLACGLRPDAVLVVTPGDGAVLLALLRALAAEGSAAPCLLPEGAPLPPEVAAAPEAGRIARTGPSDWPGGARRPLLVLDHAAGADAARWGDAAAPQATVLLRGHAPDAMEAALGGRPALRIPGIADVRVVLPFGGDHPLAALAALPPGAPEPRALAHLFRSAPPVMGDAEARALLGIHRGGAAAALIAQSYALAHHAREAEAARQGEDRRRRENADIRRERDEARAQVAALHASTSWRLLSPARRLVLLARGRGGGA